MSNPVFELKFDIDLSPLERLESLLDPKDGTLHGELVAIVQDTGMLLEAEWVRQAQTALKSYGGYANAIQDGRSYPFEDDPLHYVIINKHPAVEFLENGINPFDMKKALLTSGKVKIGKNGKRFLHIPFEHSADSLRRAGIDPDETRSLRGSMRLPRAGVDEPNRYAWGDRLTDMGDLGKRRKFFSHATGKAPHKTVDYTWKASPFENVTRFEDAKGNTTGFTSFRTMSENSDENAWQHPGIRAMRIAETAVESIRAGYHMRMAEAVKSALESSGISSPS